MHLCICVSQYQWGMTGNIRYFNDRAAQCVFIALVKADKLHIHEQRRDFSA